MQEEVELRPQITEERDNTDEILQTLFKDSQPEESHLEGLQPQEATQWEPPFDLRVIRPRAVDLRQLWKATGQPVPPTIEATLGPKRPILLSHVITPFAQNGRSPRGVWGLGYEFILHGSDGNTESVMPNNEVLKIGQVGQTIDLGLGLSGEIGLPTTKLQSLSNIAGISLPGARITAATDQRFHFELNFSLTLRKVVGAPVGIGGAVWKMYRQDERLDCPHSLLQTLLLPEKTKQIKCTIKTWAKQAGFFGTRIGEKFCEYPDIDFNIDVSSE
jgi:hypothetical protein